MKNKIKKLAGTPEIKTTGALLLLAWVLSAASVSAQSLSDNDLNRINFEQKLDAQTSLDLPFVDESGRAVKLGDYFGGKPVVLVLGYYKCPMLCTLTLNGMVEALEDMRWTAGNQFNIVNVSIDPNETSGLAAAKKATYLKRYGRRGAGKGWHFLTGNQPAIKKLADEVGFQYAYDPAVGQYAHPSGFVILTPQGRVAKYFFGVNFSPNDIFAALDGAAGNHVGSRIQQLVFLCFCYSPIKGRYGTAIMLTVRILGAATLLGLGWMFISMMRREKLRAVSIAAEPEVSVAPVESNRPPPRSA